MGYAVGFLIGNILVYHSKIQMGYGFVFIICAFTIAGGMYGGCPTGLF